jgi:hypothetical protein
MKDFIPYEQALELKKLGFNEPCFGYYYTLNGKDYKFAEKGEYYRLDDEINLGPKFSLLVPTFSQAFRFFREKYNLIHEISWSKYKGGLNFDYDVFSLVLPTDDVLGDDDDIALDKSMETYDSLVEKNFRYKESDTYEEAELACLNKLIEILKQKTYEQR